jgi:hypothetical protein
MAQPGLVVYASVAEYRAHYLNSYCRGVIQTADGMRVYFKPVSFDHAFYESTKRDGAKDAFSQVRAQRIDWIQATLASPDADLFAGYDKASNTHSHARRVAVVYEDFVVVISIGAAKDGALKGSFVTCYQADNSIGKIRLAPLWSRADCLHDLGI